MSRRRLYGQTDPESRQSGSSSNQTTESLQSIGASTGLAAIRPNGTSTLFQYYQDKQGRIIENQYNNGKWLIQGDSVPKSSIVGSDASGGSPIAATSYLLSGTLFVSTGSQGKQCQLSNIIRDKSSILTAMAKL